MEENMNVTDVEVNEETETCESGNNGAMLIGAGIALAAIGVAAGGKKLYDWLKKRKEGKVVVEPVDEDYEYVESETYDDSTEEE